MYGLERGLPGRRTVHARMGQGKPLAYSTSGRAGVGATSKAIRAGCAKPLPSGVGSMSLCRFLIPCRTAVLEFVASPIREAVRGAEGQSTTE